MPERNFSYKQNVNRTETKTELIMGKFIPIRCNTLPAIMS